MDTKRFRRAVTKFVGPLAGTVAMAVGGLAMGAPPAVRPNVLFIAVDDMNNDLRCYGVKDVQSPAIDALASRGVKFERAYCQYPLCSPSRSSMFTGLRPDTIRVFDLKYHFRQELPDVVTMPQMFSNNGYYVARVGKMYHYGNPGDIGTNSLDDKASWQERFNPAGRDKTTLELDVINYTPKRGLGAAMGWLSDATGKDEEHTDGKVADQAIALMEKHKDKPFFLGVGFYRPHCPWITPKKYFDMYSIEKISIPAVTQQVLKDYPAEALASTRPWPNWGVTTEQSRECKRAYWASISFVDAQVGRVVDAVDKMGLSDRTIIVFWSDHGFHLGEHGLWFKQSCFEESARAPMIIVTPGMKTAGQSCPRTVESVDIYPTLAELTGLTAPKGLEGASLKTLLENPQASWDRPAYTQVERASGPGHSVRTEHWRYTEWSFGKLGEELYDEQADPHELHNLSSDSKYAETVTQMKALLKKVHPKPVEGGTAAPDTKKRWSN